MPGFILAHQGHNRSACVKPATINQTLTANLSNRPARSSGITKTENVASAPLPPPTGIDLVTQAVDYVRTRLDRSSPIGERLRTLWAAVVAARDLGASDVVEEEFFRLARETGLVDDLGRRADADLRHVIRWAMLDRNPLQ